MTDTSSSSAALVRGASFVAKCFAPFFFFLAIAMLHTYYQHATSTMQSATK